MNDIDAPKPIGPLAHPGHVVPATGYAGDVVLDWFWGKYVPYVFLINPGLSAIGRRGRFDSAAWQSTVRFNLKKITGR